VEREPVELPTTGFTFEVDGNSEEVERLRLALMNEMSRIMLDNAVREYERDFLGFFRYPQYRFGRLNVKGTFTIRKAIS
jgi:hypothetical protein